MPNLTFFSNVREINSTKADRERGGLKRRMTMRRRPDKIVNYFLKSCYSGGRWRAYRNIVPYL